MKKLLLILPLILILCFMVGCQDKEAMAELEAFKAQAEVEEQNKELIRNYLAEVVKGNIDIVQKVCAANALFYFPSNSSNPMSREEMLEGAKNSLRAFSDINYKIEEMIAEGDEVLVRFINQSTHKEEFAGIPATGKRIEFSGISLFRIEDGMIVEEREEADMLGMMTQLGMELRPKEE